MPLPKGLEFLHFGWWVVHVIAILLVYTIAYRRGRRDEHRDQRVRNAAREAARRTPESGT
jgi:hypothetical protein